MKNYYVYVLKSVKENRIYIGSTQDVHKRIALHNSGKVRSTKAYKPWSLLETHSYNSRSEALAAEKFYKSGQQRELVKKRHAI